MSTERDDKFRRQYMNRRSIMDIGMGLIIAGFGVFFAFSDRFGFIVDLEPFFLYMFSGLCLLYGGFRIYRGFKQNYFKE